MAWVVSIIISLAFMVIGELLRPKVKPPNAKPASIDDFDIPTTSETRNWPWFAGKVHIKGGNITWYGDLKTIPIKKKVKTGLWSSTRVTINNKYYLGMEMFLGIGGDAGIEDVHEIRFGGRMPDASKYTKTSTADEIAFTFNDENFFGGKEKDGGVAGTVRIAKGTNSQNANSYLQSVLGRTRSAYRGLCYAVFEGFYFGTRESLKPISFVVSRYPNTLGVLGGKHKIGDDANPMCMIYELLTDQRWGAAIPSADIDAENFRAIADTLHAEGFGLSMLVNSARTAEDLIAEILRHIDGVLYTDLETGLLTVAIARADYDIATLPLFDETSIESFRFSRGSWSETKNTLMVSFIDRAQDYAERTIPMRDTANIYGRGGAVEAESVDFLGFSNPDAAVKRAAVTLKTLSYPLLNGKLVLNGKGWKLRPGSVIKVNWPPEGIEGLVLRITRINYGDIKRNRIEVDCLEDIFSVANTVYAAPPPTNWENPLDSPQPLAEQHAIEAPYHLVGAEARYIATFGARFSGIDQGYNAWHDPTGGTNYVEGVANNNFTPTGVIAAGYPLSESVVDSTGFVLSAPRDMEIVASVSSDEQRYGDSLALIVSSAGEEWIAFKTVVDNGDGTLSIKDVWRGVLDTVPLDHPANARVWFFSYGVGLFSETPYASNLAISGKLLPFNPSGSLDLADATQLVVPLSQRAWKPYPAGNVRVNNLFYPTTVVGDAQLTWSRRHRVEQYAAERIVAQNESDFSANLEGTFTISVYVGATLRQTVTSVTASPFTYTATQRVAHDNDGLKAVRLVIEPVNGSLVGRAQERTFTMTGFGMTFGQHFGGIQG